MDEETKQKDEKKKDHCIGILLQNKPANRDYGC